MATERRLRAAFTASIAAASAAVGCSSESAAPVRYCGIGDAQATEAGETPSDPFLAPDASTTLPSGGCAAGYPCNNECATICNDADPLGKRTCTLGVLYACTQTDGGVRCVASCPICMGGRGSACVRAGAAHATVLARLAYLEAASVAAFARLRAELRHHRAPRALLRRCSGARRDEIRHTRAMKAFARRHDDVVVRPMVDDLPLRSLGAMAIENAIEGCVRETFGALVATWQSIRADDREVRATMKRIARDERA